MRDLAPLAASLVRTWLELDAQPFGNAVDEVEVGDDRRHPVDFLVGEASLPQCLDVP